MPTRLRGSARTAASAPRRCVYVGHGTRYENPFTPGDPSPSSPGQQMTAEEAVNLFAAMLRGPIGRYYAARFATVLRGLDLVCTCPLNAPCHADVLLCLANGSVSRRDAHRFTCSLEGPPR
ncbi:DUF4326 domain-containing protein [Streptomyces tubercidicus]|uniref:DUF4326 domain-containing protein n=1 Tax=Streptomyces tubercidicus TaxID=47759 RepID=UPI0036B6876F